MGIIYYPIHDYFRKKTKHTKKTSNRLQMIEKKEENRKIAEIISVNIFAKRHFNT